ncbi:unnamed protein product [Prunus armeniaca]
MGGWAIAVHGDVGVDPNLSMECQEQAKQLLTRCLNLGISALGSDLAAFDVVELFVPTTNCGGEEMKILPPNLPLPMPLTRFRGHPPGAALFGLGTTLALVKHTCPATTRLALAKMGLRLVSRFTSNWANGGGHQPIKPKGRSSPSSWPRAADKTHSLLSMSYTRRFLEKQEREIEERRRKRAEEEKEEEDDDQVAISMGMLHQSSQGK